MFNVSNSPDNKSFSVILRAKLGSIANIDDYHSWNVFLRDHRKFLRAHSAIVLLSDADRMKKAYFINTFLREQKGSCKEHLPFIIANDFDSAADFNDTTRVVFVPSAKIVNELRSLYHTSRVMFKKAVEGLEE